MRALATTSIAVVTKRHLLVVVMVLFLAVRVVSCSRVLINKNALGDKEKTSGKPVIPGNTNDVEYNSYILKNA
jgi:hypothetical protein